MSPSQIFECIDSKVWTYVRIILFSLKKFSVYITDCLQATLLLSYLEFYTQSSNWQSKPLHIISKQFLNILPIHIVMKKPFCLRIDYAGYQVNLKAKNFSFSFHNFLINATVILSDNFYTKSQELLFSAICIKPKWY